MVVRITKEFLASLDPELAKKIIINEYVKCSKDPLYCIETYFTVQAGLDILPFKLFPHQKIALEAYEKYNNNITMKTRQMGFTTFTAAYIAWNIFFKNNFKVLVISKTMNDAQKFLGDIVRIIDQVKLDHPWLAPGYDTKNKRKIIMSETNSSVEVQATGEDAGRGISGLNLLVVDEVAFIDRRNPEKMTEIWSAAGVALTTVKGKAIMISTPMGSSGWYYETYTNAKDKGWNIIDAHWIMHPSFSAGAYKWITDPSIKEGGYIKFYNETWPETILDTKKNEYIKIPKEDYKFITDGKLRSPWYDIESVRLGPQRTKRELDCSFTGTGGEVFDADILRDLKLFADSSKFFNPFEKLKGPWQKFRQFVDYDPSHKYVVVSDVATGDGSDYSTIIVFDLTAFKIVATWKDQVIPLFLASILIEVGKEFGYCPIVVENQGGGFTTLQSLKSAGYSNIYYSILQKKDPTTGMKKRKIGLWASEEVRMNGGDRLEEVIRLRELVIPCTILVEEFYNWIWDKDGKRRHAPSKNDDLIMALQHAMYYYFYVYKRHEKNKNGFRKVFSIARSTGEVVDLGNERSVIIQQSITQTNQKKSFGDIEKNLDPRILTNSEIEKTSKIRRYIV